MPELWLRDEGEGSSERVTSANPLPVKTIAAPVRTTSLLLVVKDAQLTVSTVAVTLASVSGGGIPASAIGVLCAVESNPIRLTESSDTAPTTTVGFPYAAGDKFYIWGRENMTKAQFIRTGAADATLTMQFLAEPAGGR